MNTRSETISWLDKFLQVFALSACLVMAGGAKAAPVVVINSPQASASVSVDNVSVTGTATAVGGGQGVDLVVVMDDSGSLTSSDPTRDRFSALRGLVNSFGAGANVNIGLVFFNHAATVAVPLTSASAVSGSINTALTTHATPSGGTDIGAGITSGISLFAGSATGSSKVILLFTDGMDGGTTSLSAAAAAAAQGITVNVVDLGGNTQNAQIASAGGGTTLLASNSQQLMDMFRSSQIVGLSGITVTNTTTGQAALSVSQSAGSFAAPVDLAQGQNIISVVATDTAGVSTTQQVTVIRTSTTATPTNTVAVPRSVKLRPQVIMAGFDPMLLDITDTSFKVLAVVRNGAVNISNVSVAENTGGFSTAMTEVGKLVNDDRVYSLTYTFARGSIPMNTPLHNLFGSRQGQYNITAVDAAQQTHSFPALEFGNNQDVQTAATPPTVAAYTTAGLRRLKPQVLMAGIDPILLDYSDTSFKVKAVVRPGVVALQNVSLSNGSGFAQAMTFAETLGNGDEMYSLTYTYPRGSFPATAMVDLWGRTNSSQFQVQATDGAQQTHSFPDLTMGNNPVQ